MLAGAVVAGVAMAGPGFARGEERALKLHNVHTNERATIVFKRNGRYDQAGLRELNRFLRDWRKEEPTRMDPALFDVLWEAYRQTGSHDYINVICGYRSPETNGMLRRRSKGVAKNSLHMNGQAIDFYIPDVKLATLREVGLKMQAGGVGFYPTSGSPFVHLDTGSVRHWPRMTRQQLVKVFPNGNTIHVPSDGKPLPGYAQALAAYKARQAGRTTAVASLEPATRDRRSTGAPLVIASIADDEAEDDLIAAETSRAVAVATRANDPVPLPRLPPVRTPLPIVADARPPLAEEPVAPVPAPVVAALDIQPQTLASFTFGSPGDWSAPAVPADLAAAIAARDQSRRGASLPIAPTAVVATIDVNRPLRAEAMTTAVLRLGPSPGATIPPVMSYAALDPAPAARPHQARVTAAGVPIPLVSPRHAAANARLAASRSVEPLRQMQAPDLTLTTLDTLGLRLWIGSNSTRQRSFALLTMPDFSLTPGITDKPWVSFGHGFSRTAYADLRTDHFSGPLVLQPAVVDLAPQALVASTR